MSFAAINQNRYIVAVTDVKTLKTRTLTLPIRPSQNYPAIYNYGWSADQAYLAIVIKDNGSKQFFLWSTKNYTLISPGIHLVFREASKSEVAWSPMGHHLAINYVDQSTKSNRVGIWSPENGIEASAPWEVRREQYTLEWSPDGSQIWAEDFSGHSSATKIFGVKGNTLVPDNSEAIETSFMGWAKNSAIVWYVNSLMQNSLLSANQLKRINLSKGIDQTVATGIIDVRASPDLQRLAYIVQTQDKEERSTFTAYVADIDGTNPVVFGQVTLEPNQSLGFFGRGDGYIGNIFWSRDGRYVGIVYDGSESYRTVIASRDGVVRRQLPSAFVFWVSGDWFQYQESKTETQESLRFINVITGQTFTLLNMTYDEYGLENYGFVFSPDGRMLLSSRDLKSFTITTLGSGEIHHWNTAPLNTTYVPAVYSSRGFRRFPNWIEHMFVWSPDSEMVAYLEFVNDTDSDLVVVTHAGKELRRVRLKEFIGPLTWKQCS
jgi:hypothetical protein